MPVMCTLSDAQKREREATLLTGFKSVVIATERSIANMLFEYLESTWPW